MLVLGVWVGIEIYTNGMDGAFGGALARWDAPAATPTAGRRRRRRGVKHERGSLAQRAGAKVQSDLKAGERRDDPDADDAEDNN